MAWRQLPFGEWLPDQPNGMAPGLDVCEGVVPFTQDSYRGARALAAFSQSISSRCVGAICLDDKAQLTNIFAGTAGKLFRLNSVTGVFTDVTHVSGYSASTTRWTFCQFGERVVASNYLNSIQSFEIGSSSAFATLNASAPKARYVATVRDFVMAANLDDGSDGVRPQRVRWSAFDDATDWPAAGSADADSKQSDFQDLYWGGAGHITGLVSDLANADAVIFCRHGVFRARYVGPPPFFEFDLLEGVRGCEAPGAIASGGGICYYWSEEGFMAFNGLQTQPIGDGKVDRWFRDTCNLGRVDEIFSSYDPVNRLVLWAFPSKTCPEAYLDSILAFRPALSRWSTWAQNVECVLPAGTLGYTLEDLNNVANLDALPYSLDSSVWLGGRLQLAGFLIDHTMGFFSGNPLRARFRSKPIEDVETARRVRCMNLRAVGDFDYAADITAFVLHREDESDAYTTATAGAVLTSGVFNVRKSGRQVAVGLDYSSTAIFTKARGMMADISLEGQR